MNEIPSESESELDWVLILAPFRKDADYIAAFLQEQNVAVRHSRAENELADNLSLSPGVVIITHEALNPPVIATIGDYLASQPDWSEVPILVLLEKAAPLARIYSQLERSWPSARLMLHTRPIARLELVNSIQTNLLVRLRQKQVRDAIEREVELRLELNHRIKNILASVTSIFKMTRRSASTVEELAADFTGRLQALSNVHTAVFEAGGEEVSLSSVIAMIVAPYNGDGLSRIKASGPDVRISRTSATTIALCLHELTTNAIKYGALSQKDGSVDVVWSMSEEASPVFSLDWIETGGPAVVEPKRQGYGTKYLRSALTSVFGAAPVITFAPSGLSCHAAGPLQRLQI
ncbi:sensor histidine kinase (plasmid) [Agrobacterium tumefaciens]|uniref:sensor histidine kinase n=1 Tax=Agrobacterium tumefaciens TaxID=358 RepID=UPI0015734B77|nr:sensor histidine kinase [Agrobacterium tumefaciens]NSZ66415.1 sensor histidine kinase [Agrobacterium tumefaciens]NTA72787.1 sensor histidine kinase [Agrobacterium tumefaciens]WIE41340.1 sensor histidine kinase [Agrobacterium tumefaciens]